MAHSDPVLDLTTLVARPQIRIDKKLYPLRSVDEFSIFQFHRESHKFNRLGRLLQAKRRSKAEEREQDRLLNELTRMVLEAPEPVYARLGLVHRIQIITTFSQLLRTRDAALIAGAQPNHRAGKKNGKTTA